MKKKILLFISIAMLISGYTQDANFDWAISNGGSENEVGNEITVDQSGNVYTIGTFNGIVDFDPGAAVFNLNSNSSDNVFIQKLDALGNFVWAKQVGSIGIDQGHTITIDLNGDLLIGGQFQSTVDFNPNSGVFNLTSNGNFDLFILKLNSDGNLIWVKSIGGSSTDVIYSIRTDIYNNIFATGTYRNTVDFDPNAGISNLTSNGNSDIYVLKLDVDGNYLWANSYGNTAGDRGESLEIGGNGDVYITGKYFNSVDFDAGVGTFILNSGGLFVLKLDNNGGFIWAKSSEDVGDANGQSLGLDENENVYITGYFQNTVDFDPGTGVESYTSNGNNDIFILKLSSIGNFVWVKQMGDTNVDIGYSITVGDYGNIYTTGTFTNTVDFNPNTGVNNLVWNGAYDVFIQKLDLDGNFVWVKQIGGIGFDGSNAITTDSNNSIYTTGSYKNTIDFDPNVGVYNLTANGNSDFFIQKLSQCINKSSIQTQVECGSFLWIDGNTYVADNNTAQHLLTTVDGCDSLVTLNLTINTVNVNTTVYDPTISASANGANYQWVDCGLNYTILNGEQSQTLTPSQNGNYAVIVTENGCTDTSNCVSVLTVGLENLEEIDAVNLYPNPTSGLINIDLNSLNNVTVKVYNINGELVYSDENIQSNLYQFNLKTATGIYYVELISDGFKEQIKIIKI